MGTFPTSPRSELLIWAQSHAPQWTENAAAIGLTGSLASTYAALVANYAALALAQEDALSAARVATAAATEGFNELRRATGDRVRTIRAFAENQPKPSVVYHLAMIPAPADPKPIAAPAQPTDLRVGIDATTGAIELRWKATQPRGATGTTYLITRRTNPALPFVFVDAVGEKRFVDNTFFAGPDRVEYVVQARRSGISGPPSAILTVNFGRAGEGGGLAITSVSTQAAPTDTQPQEEAA